MQYTLIIRKYSYLRPTKFAWTLTNSDGGSFSNSGNHTSLKKCMAHAKVNCSQFKDLNTAKLITTYGFTDSDEAIESEETIDLKKFK